MTATATKPTARARVYDALVENDWANITVEENQTAVRGNPVSGKTASYDGMTKMSAYGHKGVQLTVWFGENDAFRFRDMKRAGSNFAGYATTLTTLLEAITTDYSPKYQAQREADYAERRRQEQAAKVAREDRVARLDAVVREVVQQRLANYIGLNQREGADKLAAGILASDVLCDDVVLPSFEDEGEVRVTSGRVVRALFARES